MPLYITSIEKQPMDCFQGFTTARGGHGVMPFVMNMYRGTIDGLPPGLDALIFCSDLQAVDRDDGPVSLRRLMGGVIAHKLGAMFNGHDLPDGLRVGVALCGDLYAYPDFRARGGLGDVIGVWQAFAQHFKWVVGVAGNHDSFDGKQKIASDFGVANAYGLDGQVLTLDGLRIGGVSGVIGQSKKPWRRPQSEYIDAMHNVLRQDVDIMLTHPSPVPQPGWIGEPDITHCYSQYEPVLAASGHVHWPEYFVRSQRGDQWLNVDARVVVLLRG